MTAPIAVERPRQRLRGLAGSPLVVLLMTVLAGFLLAGQVRGDQRIEQPLEAETEEDLARILASLNSEADALREEISALRLQLVELENSTEREGAAAEAAAAQLRALQVLSGTVPVRGPGVTVVIRDTEAAVGYANLIDVVQELRDAGAEAIAINDRRIGAASAFGERGDSITLDGEVLVAPYRVRAIGHPQTLDGGLKIPGGAVDTLSALRDVSVVVSRETALVLPALAETPSFEVARPVASDE